MIKTAAMDGTAPTDENARRSKDGMRASRIAVIAAENMVER